MSKVELNIHLQQFTAPEILEAVNAGREKPLLDASTFQSWMQRGHLPVNPSGGGRGRERLFPAVDGFKANFLAETVGLGLPVADASALLRYVGDRAGEMAVLGEGTRGPRLLLVTLGPTGDRLILPCHAADAPGVDGAPAVLVINVDAIIWRATGELDRIAKRKGVSQDDEGRAGLEHALAHWERRLLGLSHELARAAEAGGNLAPIIAEMREASFMVSRMRGKLDRAPAPDIGASRPSAKPVAPELSESKSPPPGNSGGRGRP